MEFSAKGHPNIRGSHRTTLEFTKDSEVSIHGDCILGVCADFDIKKLHIFVREHYNKRIKILISSGSFRDELTAELNPNFSDTHEIVIRKSEFISPRTFAIKASKACVDLNRDLINNLKDKIVNISVQIEIV
jgi:hypothetical protein